MRILTTLFLALVCQIGLAQSPEIFSDDNGAIRGYDPVSYFDNDGPKLGLDEFVFEWKGARWYFASQDNLDAFADDPEFYAPQYGGYCAYAVSKGYPYQSDPLAWKIVDEKLYLNYSRKIQVKWEADQRDHIQQANANWPSVLEK